MIEQVGEPESEDARAAAAVEQPPASVETQFLREDRLQLRRVRRPAGSVVRGGAFVDGRVVHRFGQRPLKASQKIVSKPAMKRVKKMPPNQSIERGW